MPQHKGGKKGSRKYGRNVEKCGRYRASRVLRRRKIRNLMLYCALTREQADQRWDATRQRGVTTHLGRKRVTLG